jgi:hypothetical protein
LIKTLLNPQSIASKAQISGANNYDSGALEYLAVHPKLRQLFFKGNQLLIESETLQEIKSQ